MENPTMIKTKVYFGTKQYPKHINTVNTIYLKEHVNK
jgi:hypothetical protein